MNVPLTPFRGQWSAHANQVTRSPHSRVITEQHRPHHPLDRHAVVDDGIAQHAARDRGPRPDHDVWAEPRASNDGAMRTTCGEYLSRVSRVLAIGVLEAFPITQIEIGLLPGAGLPAGGRWRLKERSAVGKAGWLVLAGEMIRSPSGLRSVSIRQRA